MWAAGSCASARLAGPISEREIADRVVWHGRWRTDLDELRALFASNCRARAWLQYGRVPYLAGGDIMDLRFESPLRANFTRMSLDQGVNGCPSYVTNWEPPRLALVAGRGD